MFGNSKQALSVSSPATQDLGLLFSQVVACSEGLEGSNIKPVHLVGDFLANKVLIPTIFAGRTGERCGDNGGALLSVNVT